MKEEKKLAPNRPSPEGRMIGEQLARFCDIEEARLIKKFPNHAQRCKSCAFRAGTVPNGCLPTVMDALKATLEHTPFMCHQHFDKDGSATDLCAGAAILLGSQLHESEDLKALAADWEYSF